MADKSFGLKQVNLIGASGTPRIESPNNLNINATNVAISTDMSVGGQLSLGTGTSISSPGSNILTLGTNSVERVRINSTGNVGIGTSTPSQKMHLYQPLTNSQCYLHIQNNRARNAAVKYETTQGAWYTGTGIGADQNRFTIYQDGVGDRVIVTSTGNVQIANGNLVFSTSGTGIDFSAASGSSAGSTSALLDDYEEGTWTPTYESSGASFTYASNTAGSYVKIGRMVLCRGTIRTNSVSGGTAGNSVSIGGLPFTVNNNSYGNESGWNSVHVFVGASGTYNGEYPTSGQTTPNTTTALLFYRNTSDGNTNILTYADLKDGSNQSFIKFSLQYEV